MDDANEAKGWMELLDKGSVVADSEEMQWLVIESLELTKILVKSYGTAKRNEERQKRIEKSQKKRGGRTR